MQLTSHLESDSRVVAVSGYPLVLSRTLEPDLLDLLNGSSLPA
jgi:hypothetical protein